MTPAAILEHDGLKQPIKEWALDYGITPAIIIARLERGMTIADAITTPMKTGYRGQKLVSRDMETFIASNARRAAPKPSKPSKPSKPNGPRAKSGHTYTHDGKTLTVKEWSELTGLKTGTIRLRIHSGWSFDRVFAPKVAKPKQVKIAKPKRCVTGMTRAELVAAAERVGVKPGTIWSRMDRGWTLERALSEPCGPNNGKSREPGVVSDFAPSEGTGAGSTLQERPNLTFSGNDA
jgi:hypothetical protein